MTVLSLHIILILNQKLSFVMIEVFDMRIIWSGILLFYYQNNRIDSAKIDITLFYRFSEIFSFHATFPYKVRTTRVRSKKKGSEPQWKIPR